MGGTQNSATTGVSVHGNSFRRNEFTAVERHRGRTRGSRRGKGQEHHCHHFHSSGRTSATRRTWLQLHGERRRKITLVSKVSPADSLLQASIGPSGPKTRRTTYSSNQRAPRLLPKDSTGSYSFEHLKSSGGNARLTWSPWRPQFEKSSTFETYYHFQKID